jgi:RNA polymerase sigma-70 factor (ECF subfamily)
MVDRCIRGDSGACRELVDRYQHLVFRLCCRLLRCRHDAEDVTQEVFLRVFRSLHHWDPQRPLRPWIIGIAVNRCRTWLKRRSRRLATTDYEIEPVDPRPNSAVDGELVSVIQQTVASMRPEYQVAFLLFHEQGCSYDEIAAALERPVGTIKTWLHRARLEILDQLRARGFVDPVAKGKGASHD